MQPGSWTPMRVLVADFTPAPFQVPNTLNRQLNQPGDSVEVTTQAALHAGGPYANAASRVTARLFPQALDITNPAAAGFEFASLEPSGTCSSQRGPDVVTVHQADTATDGKGEFATRFTLPDANMLSARLEVESAVRDERGKYVANRSHAEFRGRDRFVGLHSEHWTLEEGKPATVQYLVVDKTGKVIQGAPLTVSIKVEVVNAARVKGAVSDELRGAMAGRWRLHRHVAERPASLHLHAKPSRPLQHHGRHFRRPRPPAHHRAMRVGDRQRPSTLARTRRHELECRA